MDGDSKPFDENQEIQQYDTSDHTRGGASNNEQYRTRKILETVITYESAKEDNTNLLPKLEYLQKRADFFGLILDHEEDVKQIIARHLGLRTHNAIRLIDWPDWMHGSFNVCIKVDVEQDEGEEPMQLMIRFALPYKIGEAFCPGNADEKVCSEAGTYVWLEDNCPTIPIPHLYGFGLSNRRRFMSIESLPTLTSTLHRVRRWIWKSLGYDIPTRFIMETSKLSPISDLSYLLIEYIKPEQGQMLATTWDEGRHDPERRFNFYTGLARILLALAQCPLPRIGSFTIDDAGYLKLSNRPLTKELHQLENEGLTSDIPRDETYTNVGSYVNALLSYHDSRLRHLPNAILDFAHGLEQTCAFVAMRATWPSFFRAAHRRGPFFLTFTDVLQPNIFVDENWNITALVDLEWACSLPIEMIHPPWWLGGGTIGCVDAEEYAVLHAEFCTAMMKVEENRLEFLQKSPRLSTTLHDTWRRGTLWYCLGLNSPSGLNHNFYGKLRLLFGDYSDETFLVGTFPFYTFECREFLDQRVEDKEKYDIELRNAFLASPD